MQTLLQRWSKATEELKIYDKQLQEIVPSETFQRILTGQVRPITNPKLQLFKVQKKVVRKRTSK
jgi:hypothetical protein